MRRFGELLGEFLVESGIAGAFMLIVGSVVFVGICMLLMGAWFLTFQGVNLVLGGGGNPHGWLVIIEGVVATAIDILAAFGIWLLGSKL